MHDDDARVEPHLRCCWFGCEAARCDYSGVCVDHYALVSCGTGSECVSVFYGGTQVPAYTFNDGDEDLDWYIHDPHDNPAKGFDYQAPEGFMWEATKKYVDWLAESAF